MRPPARVSVCERERDGEHGGFASLADFIHSLFVMVSSFPCVAPLMIQHPLIRPRPCPCTHARTDAYTHARTDAYTHAHACMHTTAASARRRTTRTKSLSGSSRKSDGVRTLRLLLLPLMLLLLLLVLLPQ